MVIILDTPFSLGDLSQETYPHVYITQTHINGPANTVTVQYEVGTMGQGNSWTSAPFPTSKMIVLQGRDLAPFVLTKPQDLETSLWEQVERVIYEEVQTKDARLKGQLGAGYMESETTTDSTTKDPEAEHTQTTDDKAASDSETTTTPASSDTESQPSESASGTQSEPSADSSTSEPQAAPSEQESTVAQPEAEPASDTAPAAESEQNVKAPTEEAPATENEAKAPEADAEATTPSNAG